jgi:hypothetical protein
MRTRAMSMIQSVVVMATTIQARALSQRQPGGW